MGRSGAVAVLAVVLLAAATLVACGTEPLAITATPASALFDSPVHTTVTGLSAGAAATVTATARDTRGRDWSSRATFTADDDGTVHLDQPSTGGSYRGADPMGLFEMLRPATALPPATSVDDFLSPAGSTVTLRVDAEGRQASTTVRRETPAQQGVTERSLTLAADGVVGTLYLPARPAARPAAAVLTIGGSEGGLATAPLAATLAAHGHPALAVAYFRAPGLPPTLANIPLEYFAKALTALRGQPGVDPRRVYTFGGSRGSEAALLLAVHFPHLVYGVLGGSPGTVVYGSYPPGTTAWTLGGTPLPTAAADDWDNPEPLDAPQAIIPVQNIHGPLVLVCGADDQVWTSCPYSEAAAHRRPGRSTTVLRYPGAGHLLDLLLPYLAASKLADQPLPTGGTPLGDKQAEARAWPAVLAALAR